MKIDKELFRSGGVLPTGPVSLWPKELHNKLIAQDGGPTDSKGNSPIPKKQELVQHSTKVEVGIGQMAKNFKNTTGQALANGKVAEEIREERYATCKACPKFIEDTERCAACGCFMKMKTWVGGDPKVLCPLKKWER